MVCGLLLGVSPCVVPGGGGGGLWRVVGSTPGVATMQSSWETGGPELACCRSYHEI